MTDISNKGQTYSRVARNQFRQRFSETCEQKKAIHRILSFRIESFLFIIIN